MTAALQTMARLSQVELRPRRTDMAALARRIFARLRGAQPPGELTFEVDAVPAAIVDFALACTLLENLLGNALKFTGRIAAARITFSASPGPSGAYVYRVQDNGVGFDPHYAYELFTPFQRLHSAEEFPGIGMGLAIARRIVARHGGLIWATSEPEAGTTVSFTFHDPDVHKAPLPRRTHIAEDATGQWSDPPSR